MLTQINPMIRYLLPVTFDVAECRPHNLWEVHV
jgi:hypothetical protein